MIEKKMVNRQILKTIKILICCLLIGLPISIFGQTYKGLAVKKEKLISVLRSKQLQTREIVNIINSNGVDFQMTPTVQTELVGAGARPEVIEAVRNNYRAPAIVKPSPGMTGKTKFSGNPLGKEAIITLLENGVADAQVRKNVESRGVSFKSTPQIKAEIKSAGGSIALLNLIAASYVSGERSAPTSSGYTAANAPVDYDSLIDKAVDLYDNKKDKQGALDALQQAVKLDASNARAYQLLGFMNLYGLSNFAEAERNMQESLSRGGSAVFRVFHDHDGLFTDTCTGSLYVARDAVRFESDDNVHTFQTNDTDIQKIKTNSAFKRAFQTKQGSFQIVLKSGDEKNGIKYSFAPLTDDIAESKMVIRLIGKN
jgi:hypothetical protein